MNKPKLVIFDLDGTVAKIGKATLRDTAIKLRKIEKAGCKIAFCSGKPTFYLCGFVRQLSLSEPILVGENGGEIQFGIELPPLKYSVQFIPNHVKEKLAEIKSALVEKFGDRIWYQPNITALTPFFKFKEDAPEIEKTILSLIDEKCDVKYCSHVDCFDIQYKNISKGTGLKLLSEMTGILPSQMLSVGDWRNDYPMFEFTGTSFGINIPEREKATRVFSSITEALDCILSIVS